MPNSNNAIVTLSGSKEVKETKGKAAENKVEINPVPAMLPTVPTVPGFKAFQGFNVINEGFQAIELASKAFNDKVSALKPTVYGFLDSCKGQGINMTGNLSAIIARYGVKVSSIIIEATETKGIEAMKESAIAGNKLVAFLDREENKVSKRTAQAYVSEWRKDESKKEAAGIVAEKLQLPVDVTLAYNNLLGEVEKAKETLKKLGYKLNYTLAGVKKTGK